MKAQTSRHKLPDGGDAVMTARCRVLPGGAEGAVNKGLCEEIDIIRFLELSDSG